MDVCDVKNVIYSQILKPIFLSPNLCETQITKNIKLHFRIDIFYRSVISSFAVKLFSQPFTSHCSTQNIGFSDSGYVMKPPQLSSAFYREPPRDSAATNWHFPGGGQNDV